MWVKCLWCHSIHHFAVSPFFCAYYKMSPPLPTMLHAREQVAPQDSSDPTHRPRHNVFATRPDRPLRAKGPRLLFNSHIDTVPPFMAARRGQTAAGDAALWGRGACDTKGILAAQLMALQSLVDGSDDDGAAPVKDVGLLYVVSEETDHSGMLKSNELNLDPEWLVVGEPTELKLMQLQKGMLKLRLTAEGVACHSGYPELGRSAIDALLDCLQQLRTTAWPASDELGATTLNIGLISGGQAANALAESAEATVMFRLTCPPAVVLAEVEAAAAACGCRCFVVTQNAPVALTAPPLEGMETAVASYNTDVAYFTFSGKAVLFGPGSIQDAHARGEKVLVKDLHAAVDAYKRIARHCLSSDTSVV
ncbi:unnamed protein product [Phaeothamnion confervicola]